MRRTVLALVRSWQPAAVVAGALACITGLTGTAAVTLGAWPAVSVAGALVCAAALAWGRLTLMEDE